MDDNYTLYSFKGPDRVRKRPVVAFGSDTVEGSFAAFKMLMEVFIFEAKLGYCSHIEIVFYEDFSISIHSFDRGLYLDETVAEGKPGWYYDFCDFYAGPREPDEKYYVELANKHNMLYGESRVTEKRCKVYADHATNLCCVQYASEYMNIEAVHQNVKKKLSFKKGYNVTDVRKESTNDLQGTYIHFLLDKEVFKDINIPLFMIDNYLKEVSSENPELDVEVTYKSTSKITP